MKSMPLLACVAICAMSCVLWSAEASASCYTYKSCEACIDAGCSWDKTFTDCESSTWGSVTTKDKCPRNYPANTIVFIILHGLLVLFVLVRDIRAAYCSAQAQESNNLSLKAGSLDDLNNLTSDQRSAVALAAAGERILWADFKIQTPALPSGCPCCTLSIVHYILSGIALLINLIMGGLVTKGLPLFVVLFVPSIIGGFLFIINVVLLCTFYGLCRPRAGSPASFQSNLQTVLYILTPTRAITMTRISYSNSNLGNLLNDYSVSATNLDQMPALQLSPGCSVTVGHDSCFVSSIFWDANMAAIAAMRPGMLNMQLMPTKGFSNIARGQEVYELLQRLQMAARQGRAEQPQQQQPGTYGNSSMPAPPMPTMPPAPAVMSLPLLVPSPPSPMNSNRQGPPPPYNAPPAPAQNVSAVMMPTFAFMPPPSGNNMAFMTPPPPSAPVMMLSEDPGAPGASAGAGGFTDPAKPQYCRGCGSSLSADSKFCSKCGLRL